MCILSCFFSTIKAFPKPISPRTHTHTHNESHLHALKLPIPRRKVEGCPALLVLLVGLHALLLKQLRQPSSIAW